MLAGGYKIRDQHGIYYLTFTVVDWIDMCLRENVTRIYFWIVWNIAKRKKVW